MGFAIMVLLVPVICPMLYFCGVDCERRSPGQGAGHRPRVSEVGRWALITAVVAGLLTVVGLAIPNLYLTLAGIAGVIVSAGTLVWLVESAIEQSAQLT